MADEARISNSLQIKVGSLEYRSQPTAFYADVSTAKGPTPGLVSCTQAGTDVDLSLLTTPGLCRIQNLDDTNKIIVGRWDPDNSRFYPMMDLLAGETFVIRLAADVEDEYSGTGTGTTATASTLRIKGTNATCLALVEAFEK